MSREVGMLLFTAIVVFGVVSVPLIGLLIKHQQTMARILRDSNYSEQVDGQLESMRNEILQLTATVGALKASLLSRKNHENRDELASRIGSAS